MSEQFGCCSRYIECSDKMSCVNVERRDFCQYWIYNLSKGRSFYSSNKSDFNIKSLVDINGDSYEQISMF